MKKILGYLRALTGTFFAQDAEGHRRELHPGDPVFVGEIVVDAKGQVAQDVLRPAKSHTEEETGSEEQAHETETSGNEEAPYHLGYKVRSTTHTDHLDSNYAEINVQAPLDTDAWLTQNGGIPRRIYPGEVNINAPLEENYFANPGNENPSDVFPPLSPSNDMPVARPDINDVTEDDPDEMGYDDGDPDTTIVTGNVLVNDSFGADLPVVLSSFRSENTGSQGSFGAPLAGSFGELVLQPDGSYRYILDNNNPAVQRISTGETLTETFRYTITDIDGDSSSTTLTITIHGTGDVPHITPDGDKLVKEEALDVHGSNPTSNEESATGHIAIVAKDGLDHITIAGTNVTEAQLLNSSTTPVVITTTYGQLTITNFTPTDPTHQEGNGTIDYTYTILTNTTDHSIQGKDSVIDHIPLKVVERDGSEATGNIDVTIVDDVPTATDDTGSIQEDTAPNPISGNVVTNDTLGADQTTTPVTAIHSDNTSTDGTVGQPLSGAYGTLTLNDDGTYSYTLDNSNSAVDALNVNDTLTETYSYTITDGDGDTSTAKLTFTITGTNDAPVAQDVSDDYHEDPIVAGNVSGTTNLLTIASDVDDPHSSLQIGTVKYNGTTYNAGQSVNVDFTYTDKNGNSATQSVPVTINADGTYKIDQTNLNPMPINEEATAQLQFTVVDTHGGTSSEQTLTLKITGDNDAPDAVDDTITQVITHDVDVTPPHAVINLGNDSAFDLSTGFTISQKVNVTGAGIVFNKENSYEMAVFGDGSVRYALQGPHSGWAWTDTGYKLPFNETHVLTTTYDGATQKFAVYVDGEEVFSGSQNVPASLRQLPNNDLLFGERGSNRQPIEGTFDDIQIYSKPLSASEIGDIADGKTIGHDLVAYYTFETSTPLTDLSGNGHTATLQNGATVVEHTGNPTEDIPFTIKASDILANDSDIDSSQFNLISVQNATHGTVSLDSDGNVYFVPDKDYSGPASFTYTIQDNSGDASSDKATATVNFNIDPVNDAPVAIDHDDAFHEDNIVLDNLDGTVDGEIQGNVNLLTGVTDVDNPSGPFEIGAVEGSTARVGHPYYVTFNFHNSNTGQEDFVKANVTINADGSYTIDQTDINKMPQGDVATGVISYQVKDPAGALSTAKKLTITVTGDNDAPDAVDDTQIGDLNTVVDVTPTHAAINVGKMNDITDAFTISQDIKVTGSGIVFNKENTYEVAVEGDGSIRYAMRDANGHGWVWNDTGYDLPLNTEKNLTVVYDGSVQELRFYVDGTRVATSTANVGSALSTHYSSNALLFGERGSNNQPLEGTFDNILVYKTALSDAEVATIASGGSVSTGLIGKYDFEGNNPLDDKSNSGNDATLQNGATLVQNFGGNLHDIETKEDTPLTFDGAKLLVNDSEVDLDPIHVVSVAATADTHGTVSYDSNTGQITYTPDPDFNGIAKFDYTIEDSHGAQDTATVTVKVDATPDLRPDTLDVVEGTTPAVTGNVLNNDDVGTTPGTVTSFQYIDNSGTNRTANVPAGGSVTVTTQYGQITMHSDGTYEYLPASELSHPSDGNTDSASLADTITYVVTDDNGDTASTTLTVNVQDTIATVSPVQATLYESGIPGLGSDTSKPYSVSGASLGVTAGADSLDIVFVQNQLDNDGLMKATTSGGEHLKFEISNNGHDLTAKTVTSDETVFTMTLHPNGSSSTYDFTLFKPFDNGGLFRDMRIPFTLNETDDTLSGKTWTRVWDDVPTAANDSDDVTEDAADESGHDDGNADTSIIAGDVFANDTLGADRPPQAVSIASNDTGASGTIGQPLVGVYGTLTLNADGTYTYTLDNTNPAVQHLIDGESLSESFQYKMKNYDGHGVSTADLTVTINGTDDGVTITPIDGNDGDPHPSGHATVYEAGLDHIGSDPTSDSEKTDGTITISAKDGLGQVIITDENGNDVAIDEAALRDSTSHPITVNTKYGHLVIDGFTPIHTEEDGSGHLLDGSGTIHYTYTLTHNTLDHSAQGNDEVTDAIALKVEDRDGDSDTSTLNITVVDDVPTASDNVKRTTEGHTLIGGNVITNDDTTYGKDVGGADGVQLYRIHYADASGTSHDFYFNDNNWHTFQTKTGELKIRQNGAWRFTPVADYDHDDDPTGVGNQKNNAWDGSFRYWLIDGDGDISNRATMRIDVKDTRARMRPESGGVIDEDDLPNGSDGSDPTSVTKSLGIAPGKDPVEDIRFVQSDVDAFVQKYKSGGQVLSAKLENNDHKLVAYITEVNGFEKSIFEVTINPDTANYANSTYTFELKGHLDHPNGHGQNKLNMSVPFQLVEQDDYVNAKAKLTVRDDVPTPVDDTDQTITEGSTGILSGNVLDNDIQGADGAMLRRFSYLNKSGNERSAWFSDTRTEVTVNTPTGKLTVHRNGVWEFDPNAKVDHDDPIQGTPGSPDMSWQGSFKYELVDGDHDRAKWEHQKVGVGDGTDPSAADVSAAVDEDDIPTIGSDGLQSNVVSGNFSVTGGSDPVEKVVFTTTGSGTLTSDGVAIDYSWDDATKTLTGTAGSNTVFTAEVTGTVNNPGYKFTLLGPIDHAAPASGADENTIVVPLEYKATDWDGDVATAKLNVTITDDIPSIGAPQNGEVFESGLSEGAHPGDPAYPVEATGSLQVAKEADRFDTYFTDDTTDLNSTTGSLLAQGITAEGKALSYTVSADGHTLTGLIDAGSANEKTIFTVAITDADSDNASYTFDLFEAIDNNDTAPTNLNIGFTVKDADEDEVQGSFNVKINDDEGQTQVNIVLDEDDTGYGFYVTADKIQSLDSDDATHGSVSLDAANNKLVYTPDANYSGKDRSDGTDYFTVTYTTTDGVTHSTKVYTVVDPVSDAPTLSVDSATVNTNEDTSVALGLNAPQLVDTTDQNGSSTPGDWPERLGAVTLEGIPNGAKLLDGSGNTLTTSNGSAITILISDLPHVNGTTADLTMTKAEFEALKVDPVAQSGDNFTVTMKASSYEVDGNGNIIDDHNGNPVAGAESTTQVTVDVQAVTDPLPDLTKVKDAHGNEDDWIRVDDTFTIHPTVDQDGSEHYTVTFDGTNLPAGTRYYVGSNPTGDGQDASGGFTVTIPNSSGVPAVPEIYIRTPDNDSADIDSLKVTVAVTDTDGDSSGSITTYSKDLTIDVDVDPVANDITLTTDPSSGNEDNLIPLNLHFTVSDTLSVPGNETVTSVTIADIPDGAKIYKADGTTLVYENNTGSTASTTITIDANTSIGDVEGFKILPPGHSSTDFTLIVGATTQDVDDGGGQATASGTIAPIDVLVEVAPVAETNTDTNLDGNTDVTLNPDHTYATHAVEDAWYDLNAADAGFALSASNEDDKNNSSNPYASEDTWVEFHSVRDSSETILIDAQIMYNNGSIDVIKTLNAPVQIPIEYLNTVKFKAPENYSGTVKVDMTLGTFDHDEDNPNSTNGPVNSLTSTLQVDVDPATDPINVAITQSNGVEDAGRNPDGTIDASSALNGIVLNSRVASLDPDGSEHINVFIDDIPEDAAIYYDIDGDGTREIITANSDFGQVNEAPQGQTGPIDVVQYDTANHTWKLLIQNYDEIQVGDRPIIIPPHNSNIDIVLKASGYAVDTTTFSDGSSQTDTSAESVPYDVNVFIGGVADEAVNNEIYLQDIDTSIDPNTHDLTVTLDPNKSGKYSAVAEEDSGTTPTTGNTDNFVEFDLKSIFKTPDKINSYDNLKTNDPDQNPVDTTVTNPNAAPDDIASETLTVTIENLGAAFDVTGATLVGGTGSSRIWATNAADIATGKVKVRTLNEHFSGEINFDLKYNTTEDDGDTKSSATQNVTLLVTPEAEGLAGVLQTTTDVREDVLTHMTFSTTTTLPDSDEYVSALGIARDDYTIANGQSFRGIENADFTIYLGNGSGKKTIQDVAADPNDHRVELVEDNGVWFYKIADRADWYNLYVLYNADIGGKEDPNNVGTAHQTDFGFKFDVSDKTQAVQNATTVDLIDTKSGFQESANYTFSLYPVTDDITADAKDGDITDVDGDGTTDITVSGHDVTISAPTTIDVSVTIKGVDTQNENGTGANGENGLDIDSSEQIRSIRIEGVPDGIGIVGGKYVGDTIDLATGLPTGNNTWLVDLNQSPIVMDAATKTYNLQFEVSGNYINAASATSDVKISFINQEYDSTLSAATPQSTAQTGDFTLTFHRDPNFGGSTTDAPMDIIGVTDVNGDGVVDEKDGYTVDPTFDTNPTDPYQGGFKEDTTTKLGDIIHLDINDVQGSLNAEENQNINSDLFSITVEGLDPNIVDVSAGGQPIHSGVVTGWRFENVNGTDILTYRGSGDKAAIEAALNALEITPKQDLNHNNINFIGQDDITFTTTLTTYTQSGVKDVVSTDFSGNIEPVTDTVSITPDHVDVQEDVVKTITFGLDTVDNSFDPDGDGTKNIFAHLVTSPTDSTPATTISVKYVGSTDVGNGQFGVTLGGVHFNPGETHDVPITVSGTTVDLDFIADSNESGKAYFEYTLYSKEDHAQNTNRHTGSLEIDIAPVADGLDTGGGNPTAYGKEDEFIQVTDANGNPFSGDLIDNATNNTTPETLKTVILGDVPPGWLVYYGSSQTLAQNLGSNGGTNNYWNIPLGSGANPVPEIYVKAPAQVGGISTQFQLISGVEDGGQQVYASVPIDVSVLAVADPITMNPSPTGGVEGEKIPLNFNTASADVDGSEHYEVKLTGLGENAVLYFQGTELTSGVTYDRRTDTYTISESVGIEHNSIDKLTVTQNDFSGTVNAEIIVHDAVPNDGTTQSASGSFAMNISQQQATSGDNTLLYDKKGVDGLGGDDTVIFGTDWDGYYDGSDAAHTIDMSALANIEILDLTEHGDHHLVMSAAEVTAMTDTRNALSIDADTGDTVVLKDEGDNIWLQNGNDFTNIADGTKVTVNDPGLVSIERATPTGGDDVIGFDGQNIDAGAGNDRIVALEGIGIDFSKLHNIETLDLSKSGDHDLGTLNLSDVMNMTDGNDTLTIEGDDANDKVTLTGGDWDSHSSAGGYTTYIHNGDGTNSDPTVTLKIDDDIAITVA